MQISVGSAQIHPAMYFFICPIIKPIHLLNQHLIKSQIATSRWGRSRKSPYVFTELGVAMLSSVLNSKTAIQINMSIMRAFIAIRQALESKPTTVAVSELQTELNQLKTYIEEVFTDYNDINEDTRVQIELINQSLAELHTDKKRIEKPRNRIGFIT
jgi:hypothetical protein